MPLYEYRCDSCEGVFELLRPARYAALPQPCPLCDEDAKRIVSRQWSAFIFREGVPRSLPDHGGYWHAGQRVSSLITSAPDSFTHPEIAGPPRVAAPSVEEIEHYEHVNEWKATNTDPEPSNMVHMDQVQAEETFVERLTSTKGTPTEEAAKRRAKRTIREIEQKKRRPKQ